MNNIKLLNALTTQLATSSCEKNNAITNFQNGIKFLENWGVSHLLHILQKNNIFTSPKKSYELNEIKEKLHILHKYHLPLNTYLAMLCQYKQLIKLKNNVFKISPHLQTSLQEILDYYPEVTANAHVLQNVLDACLDILTGKETILNILFPLGRFEKMELIYKKSPLEIYYNTMLAKIIQICINEWFKNPSHFSIIEIGAGVGATSEKILPLLSNNSRCNQYMYTDISKAFIRYAKTLFTAQYSFLNFATLDISVSPKKQNFGEQQYDFVIATNILHATENILVTLQNVKSLLKHNGILILSEGIRKNDFSTLTYGLIDGWFLFKDKNIRIPNSPLLSLKKWKQALKTSGFKTIYSFNEITKSKQPLTKDIIIAIKE